MITLRGGTLAVISRKNAASVQTMGPVLLDQGSNFITATLTAPNTGQVGSLDMTIGGLSRTAGSGATVQFAAGGVIGNSSRVLFTVAPMLTNNIIGGWATV